MPLANKQIQVRDLVMGEGTDFEVISFNPWSRSVRAPSQTPRAWNHGDWSGAEWTNAPTIPFIICIDGTLETLCEGDFDTWIDNRHLLAAAFRAIGDDTEEVELRFRYGSREYVVFGRPRLVDTESEWLSWVRAGGTSAQCAFVALDPRAYSAELSCESAGLSTQTGGLVITGNVGADDELSHGLVVPFVVTGKLVGGQIEIVNEGTAEAGLFVRIDGPAEAPGFVLQRPDGTTQSVRVFIDLLEDQWLEIDTVSGTVFLNGLSTASQRGVTVWDIDPYPLLPGTTRLRFIALDFNEDAQITACWRSAWM